MKKIVAVALFCAVAGHQLAAVPGDVQTLQFKARLEVRNANDPKSTRVTTPLFPDGFAEIDYVTDGTSFRTVTHNRISALPDGTISLRVRREQDQYVLNPVTRTYRRSRGPETEKPRGQVVVKATGAYETIAGHRAEKITALYTETVNRGAGAPPIEQRVEVESWCAKGLRVPTGMFFNMASGFLDQPSMKQLDAACPVPLRTSFTTSIMPVCRIVTTVTSLQRVAVPTTVFELPKGFRGEPR